MYDSFGAGEPSNIGNRRARKDRESKNTTAGGLALLKDMEQIQQGVGTFVSDSLSMSSSISPPFWLCQDVRRMRKRVDRMYEPAALGFLCIFCNKHFAGAIHALC